MRRSINASNPTGFQELKRLLRTAIALACMGAVPQFAADACRAQGLDRVPRPLVSQPKLAMQRAKEIREHWREGRLEQALRAAQAALLEEPNDLSLRFMRGSLLFESARYAEAQAQFEALAEQFPELAEIQNNLASLYAREGRLEEARLALERALQAQPRYALAWENLATVLARQASEALARSLEFSEGPQKGRIQGKLERARELSTQLTLP